MLRRAPMMFPWAQHDCSLVKWHLGVVHFLNVSRCDIELK